MLGSRAGVIDSYGIEGAFDLGEIYTKDCHSSWNVNWVKPLRLQAPVHAPHIRILLSVWKTPELEGLKVVFVFNFHHVNWDKKPKHRCKTGRMFYMFCISSKSTPTRLVFCRKWCLEMGVRRLVTGDSLWPWPSVLNVGVWLFHEWNGKQWSLLDSLEILRFLSEDEKLLLHFHSIFLIHPQCHSTLLLLFTCVACP